MSPSSPIGVLVAVGSAAFEAELLAAADRGRLHVVRRCVDVPDLLATAATRQAAAAIVSAQLRGIDATVVARLQREDVRVLGMTAADGESRAEEARLHRLGVGRVVDAGQLALLEELVMEACTETPERSVHATWNAADPVDADQDEPDPDPRAPVVAVWGPTGAPGRTTVSCGLAAATAGLGRRTLLVDADVYGGSVAAMLGLLDESSGLLAASRAANHGELRHDVLIRSARAITPTLRVLTGIPRADRWVEVGSILIRRVLETAAHVSDAVVVDCGFNLEADEELSYDTVAPRRNGATLEVLERADIVVAVGGADPVSLGRLIRGVNDLRTALPRVTPSVVLNRSRSSLGWSDGEMAAMVTRATGLPVTATLPADPAACDHALVHGRTLSESAPESRLTRRLAALAAELLGLSPPVRPIRRRRAGTAR